MSYRAAVITCSDRAAAQVYEDRSGPVLRDGLAALGLVVTDPVIVPDEVDAIRDAITAAVTAGARVVMTSGGTGIAPRDVTVEATRPLMTAELPGLMEEVRRRGAEHAPTALLSRGVAGIVKLEGCRPAVVINAPGSRGGAHDTIAVVGDLLSHVVEQLDGADHPDPAH